MLNIEHEDHLLLTFDFPEQVPPTIREELLAYLLTDNYLDALVTILTGHDEEAQASKLHDIFTILLMDNATMLAATDDYYRENLRLDLAGQIRDDERDDSGERFSKIVLERLIEDLAH